MATNKIDKLPRMLVVCDVTPLRRELAELLYDLLVEAHWHLQADGVADYARWCQPDVILLALRETTDNIAAYEALQAAFGSTNTLRIGMLGVPQDGIAFPSRERLALDVYLTPPASLHELAWLVRQAADSRRKPVPPVVFADEFPPAPGRPDGR